MVKVDGRRLCVVRTATGVHALDHACPHEGYGLTPGDLDGELLTCAWHNWKFRVSDGALRARRGGRAHARRSTSTTTATIRVSLAEPAPEECAARSCWPACAAASAKDYIGQISRDVVRLLRANANPGELIWEAVAYGAPRAEFGWGHSIASATDCLSMVDLYDGDQRALPIVQGIAGHRRVRSAIVRSTRCPTRSRAPGRRRAPSSAGSSRPSSSSLRRPSCAARSSRATRPTSCGRGSPTSVSDHLLSYGHGAIYAQKAFQLLERDGLGAGGHGAAAPRADDRVRHPRGQVAVHAAVRPRPRRDSISTSSPGGGDVDPRWKDDGTLRSALLGARPASGARRAGRRAARRSRHRRRARHGRARP